MGLPAGIPGSGREDHEWDPTPIPALRSLGPVWSVTVSSPEGPDETMAKPLRNIDEIVNDETEGVRDEVVRRQE